MMLDQTDDGISTRRAFLKGGAIIAAPLAIMVPGAAIGADGHKARLERLEAEAAIRALHRDWMRRVAAKADAADLFATAGAAHCLGQHVCGIAPDHGQAETLVFAADGKRAQGTYRCTIDTEHRLLGESTFEQMALLQGGGMTRTSAQHVVRADYVKLGDRWMIAGIETRVV